MDTLFCHDEWDVEQMLKAYESALVRQGRADLTRVKYVHGARTFLDWRGERLAQEVRPADVDLFLAEWESEWEVQTGRRLSRATVRARISALRSFFVYLERGGLLVGAGG